MSAPHSRTAETRRSAPHSEAAEATRSAPVPVRRPKGNPLRQYWLTGAFAMALVGVISVTGLQVFQADQDLKRVEADRAQVEAELRAARQKYSRLQETLDRVTSDEYMELTAKKMGFTKPNEKVYQTGSPKGQ